MRRRQLVAAPSAGVECAQNNLQNSERLTCSFAVAFQPEAHNLVGLRRVTDMLLRAQQA